MATVRYWVRGEFNGLVEELRTIYDTGIINNDQYHSYMESLEHISLLMKMLDDSYFLTEELMRKFEPPTLRIEWKPDDDS